MRAFNLIRQTDAAREKGVSRAAVLEAIKRGSLRTKDLHGVTMVVIDEKYRAWMKKGMDWRRKKAR